MARARTIICGLDDSAAARGAALAAASLAAPLDLSVLLAHVVSPPITIGGAAPPTPTRDSSSSRR